MLDAESSMLARCVARCRLDAGSMQARCLEAGAQRFRARIHNSGVCPHSSPDDSGLTRSEPILRRVSGRSGHRMVDYFRLYCGRGRALRKHILGTAVGVRYVARPLPLLWRAERSRGACLPQDPHAQGLPPITLLFQFGPRHSSARLRRQVAPNFARATVGEP